MTDVFCIERYKFERTTTPALRAGWRQVAAATAALNEKHEPPSPGMGDGGFLIKSGDKNKKTD